MLVCPKNRVPLSRLLSQPGSEALRVDTQLLGEIDCGHC